MKFHLSGLKFSLPLIVLLCCSCTETVSVYHSPPMDLVQYKPIGIIRFTDNAYPPVSNYLTEQFENEIHQAQTGTPLLELGNAVDVLKTVGANELDYKAFQEIGKK